MSAAAIMRRVAAEANREAVVDENSQSRTLLGMRSLWEGSSRLII